MVPPFNPSAVKEQRNSSFFINEKNPPYGGFFRHTPRAYFTILYYQVFISGVNTSMPPIYLRSTSGTTTEPSFS